MQKLSTTEAELKKSVPYKKVWFWLLGSQLRVFWSRDMIRYNKDDFFNSRR